MSRTKSLILLFEDLEKAEFDRVVKEYLKIEYQYKSIVFTDGVNDTGIDIKVFDYKANKIQFQLTVQKSKTTQERIFFDKKITDDFRKAKENHDLYGYSNKLLFFYSKELTNDRIRVYEKQAFKDYGINLELIEANRLSEEAENIPSIQTLLYNLNDVEYAKIREDIFDNKQENLIFDIVSFGKASEFKLQIIEAFILQSLFVSGSLTKDDIKVLCNEKFTVKENLDYYNKILSNLSTNKRIKKIDKFSYKLTLEEEGNLEIKNSQYDIDEQIFTRDIKNILENYLQSNFLKEYILELKKLYVKNFSIDLNTLLNNKDPSNLYAVIEDFIIFVKSKTRNEDIAKKLAKNLLEYCINNKFIQKISTSKVYCENINFNKIELYLSTQKKIFIDTSIALYALCVFYKPTATYNNYFYKATRDLLSFTRTENIKLYISQRYIWEITSHIKEAFNLIPFTRINNYSSLGSSRNVFYNYYIYLKSKDEINEDLSFSDFLLKFNFRQTMKTSALESTIESHLNGIGINKTLIEKDYNIDDVIDIFQKYLEKGGKSKTLFAVNNDGIMIEFLSDKDIDVHKLEPIFTTWDTSFFEVHNEYLSNYPTSNYWIIVTPNKLVDAYSLLKFSINSETVTENLLALVSDDIIKNTHSLIDSIAHILNIHDEVGLEYTNRLIKIREEELERINRTNIVSPENIEGEVAIDDVFYHLTNYYNQSQEKLFSFKKLFTKRDLINDVISLLKETINEYYINKNISQNIFNKFDNLILVVENLDQLSDQQSKL